MLRWRTAAAVTTVFLPLLLFMGLSDSFSKLLLPKESLTGAPSLVNTKLLPQPEQAIADWAGQINFMGLTIFLTSLCFFVVAFCVFVIVSTLKAHDEIFSTTKSTSWQSIVRTTCVCLAVSVVAAIAGIALGGNGRAKSIDRHCYSNDASFVAAEASVKNSDTWLRFDGVGDFIFDVRDFVSRPFSSPKSRERELDHQKSGSDYIREVVVSELFCKIELDDGSPTRTASPRKIMAWDILNFNTIIVYSTSIFCFITVAMLGLFSSRHVLVNRGRRLKLLLMALASLMSVGVAQLKAYFNWPVGMLNEASKKSFSALTDASANYTGLVGSATLFVTFIFPLLLLQYDTSNGTEATASEKHEGQFKLSDVLAFVALFAAPAFSGSLTKLLTGGH